MPVLTKYVVLVCLCCCSYNLCAQQSADTTKSSTEKTLERYQLVLFPFNSPLLGAQNERILKEYIYARCFASSQVDITGHSDIVGEYPINKELSKARAANTERKIRSAKPEVVQLTVQGTGEEQPLYSNSLPEGRFYNRTVQVVIRTPLEDAGVKEEVSGCD